MKYWKMSEYDLQKASAFASSIGVSNMLGGILQSRGFELSEAGSFLSGEGKLHNPYLMKGMEEAEIGRAHV